MATIKIHDLRLKIIAFLAVLISLVMLTVILSISHLHAHQEANGPRYYNCNYLGENYFVYFKDNKVTPSEIEAKPCDSITFVNQDKFRLLAFGRHDKHIDYNGVFEKPMSTGDSFSITLDKSGEYHFHDHYQEYIGGVFKVEDAIK